MTADDSDEVVTARDAIPKDAIWLSDAYESLVDFLDEHSELQPEFDEESSQALRNSRQFEEAAGHDPEAFDKELQEFWHRKKEANLLLRLGLQQGRLVACVMHPQTGDILKLLSNRIQVRPLFACKNDPL